MEYEELLFYAEEQVTVGRKRPAFLGDISLCLVGCLADIVHCSNDVVLDREALCDDVGLAVCSSDSLLEIVSS